MIYTVDQFPKLLDRANTAPGAQISFNALGPARVLSKVFADMRWSVGEDGAPTAPMRTSHQCSSPVAGMRVAPDADALPPTAHRHHAYSDRRQ